MSATLQLVASALYRLMMLAGGLWCHQRPERSPHLWGVQLPLCWRCSGILLGATALLVWLLWKKRLPKLSTSLLLALLLPLDVFIAMSGVWNGDNSLRFMTGILWGAFGMSAALHLIGRVYTLHALRRHTSIAQATARSGTVA